MNAHPSAPRPMAKRTVIPTRRAPSKLWTPYGGTVLIDMLGPEIGEAGNEAWGASRRTAVGDFPDGDRCAGTGDCEPATAGRSDPDRPLSQPKFAVPAGGGDCCGRGCRSRTPRSAGRLQQVRCA